MNAVVPRSWTQKAHGRTHQGTRSPQGRLHTARGPAQAPHREGSQDSPLLCDPPQALYSTYLAQVPYSTYRPSVPCSYVCMMPGGGTTEGTCSLQASTQASVPRRRIPPVPAHLHESPVAHEVEDPARHILAHPQLPLNATNRHTGDGQRNGDSKRGQTVLHRGGRTALVETLRRKRDSTVSW